ncbi:hypothetical protein EB796_017517 [Bugula neritina]|uniref:Uncharacterized protein n=1 Tax=Bugula neritina TaxID=10212 RepID=A0A7J7JF16_BUGNE|nr:hypothetical protein EB796_017517 [Bugula neritina]
MEKFICSNGREQTILNTILGDKYNIKVKMVIKSKDCSQKPHPSVLHLCQAVVKKQAERLKPTTVSQVSGKSYFSR